MKLTVGIAAITGSYEGTIVSDKVPPTSYRLTWKGRAARIREGEPSISCAKKEHHIVDVHGTVQTGGPVARVGQRLIGGVSKMMMDRFFACLQGKV